MCGKRFAANSLLAQQELRLAARQLLWLIPPVTSISDSVMLNSPLKYVTSPPSIQLNSAPHMPNVPREVMTP